MRIISNLPKQMRPYKNVLCWIALLTLLGCTGGLAQEAESAIDSGDTAWILTSTALVLFMTIPGLSLFYAGLVRPRNVLSVLMQCFVITALMTVIWLVAGYSLAFSEGSGGLNSVLGGLSKAFLKGIDAQTASGSIPEPLFFAF